MIGRPDPLLGSCVHAFLVLTEGQQYKPADVTRWCQQRLEPFMVPKFVTFLSEMQKTTSNKISKTNLEDFARRHKVSGDDV